MNNIERQVVGVERFLTRHARSGIAVTHVALTYSAFRSSTAFLPYDGKHPWIVGFVTALAFVVIPWAAPAAQDMLRR
jgi:hypothetical protein